MASRKNAPPAEATPPPATLPVLPLRNNVLFPNMVFPLSVGREKSLKAVEEASRSGGHLAVVAQKDERTDDPGAADLFPVGTVARIVRVIKVPDGSRSVVVQSLFRFRVKSFAAGTPWLRVEWEQLAEVEQGGTPVDALALTARNFARKILELSRRPTADLSSILDNVQQKGAVADYLAAHFAGSVAEKQSLLEELNVTARLRTLTTILQRQVELLQLSSKIQSRARSSIEKVQREYYLREQMKAIRKELGEEGEDSEIRLLRRRLKKAGLPPEVEKEARRELNRLARMTTASAEHTVSRTWLEWVLDLPWRKETADDYDLKKAARVLDEDHHGLVPVKERILEYLAVRKLKPGVRGPILCFVGPPGVGKTSLGKSIARALGRKFVRVSLGGVRDEAEIRGHRRTYIGALPGRIIQGLRKAGTPNPVFVLDEVDKLGLDFRGDPASALLEVLDPEQNHAFSDHYLELPFDLSAVMFVTTANLLEGIPFALRDRLEVLELPGYSEEEKLAIARRHLIPKQLENHGLPARSLEIGEDTLRAIIAQYTREAGLRNLERSLATLCRKVARRRVEGTRRRMKVGPAQLAEFLGPPRFYPEVAERARIPGVATGLVWTPTGGDIVFIEATRMPGRGSLILTGKLGAVMKESARAALSYTRAQAGELGVDPRLFRRSDLHIHVPEGAIPKDGPSAGVTLYAALASLLTGRRVRGSVAMTGEITLRGAVLPVGGIKEKVLGARRAGVAEVILPHRNEKDLADVPAEVKKDLRFHFISDMVEILDLALEPAAAPVGPPAHLPAPAPPPLPASGPPAAS